MCKPEFDKRPDILFTGLRVSSEQPAKQSHLLLPQITQIQAWQPICSRNAPKGLVGCKWTSMGQCLSCLNINEHWTQEKQWLIMSYDWLLIFMFEFMLIKSYLIGKWQIIKSDIVWRFFGTLGPSQTPNKIKVFFFNERRVLWRAT